MKRLLEREGVLDAAAVLLDRARKGRAGALFVLAEAGLGKSSTLERACSLASEHSFSTGLGRGEAMEAALPFGLLAQALDGLGGRDVLDGPDGPSGSDLRAARFYTVLRWLEQSAPRPALVALDDVHWADPDSLALLSFLGRRMSALPVALIATLRPWPTPAWEVAQTLTQGGFASIERLDRLSRAGATALLADRVGRPVTDAEAGQAAEACAGNPLLLEQVAAAIAHGDDIPHLEEDQWPRLHGQLLLARFAGLPPEGLQCARAAAVFGTRFRPALAVEVSGLDHRGGDRALEALERSGLVRPGRTGGAEFVHPLFRQALYDDLGVALRARFHARAFSLLVERGLAGEAVEHAVKADLAGDAAAIAVLTRVGLAARDRGAVGSAISVLESAVTLAGDNASLDLLADLAETMAAGGRTADAVRICERILGLPGMPRMIRARTLRTMARALVYQGLFEAGRQRVDECVELVRQTDPAFAVETLLAYSLVAWLIEGPAVSVGVSRRAMDLAQACDPEIRLHATAAWATSALLTGDASGVEECAAAARAAEAQGALASRTAVRLAADAYPSLARYVERLPESERFYRARLQTAERFGMVEQEASTLVSFIDTLMRMLRLDEAAEMAERAARLSDLVPLAGPLADMCRHNLALFTGHLEECDQLSRQLETNIIALAVWPAALFLDYGRAWRSLIEGRLADACDLYGRMEAMGARVGLGEPCAVPWAGHAIAAYVRAGHRSDARRIIRWLENSAISLPCRWPRITAAYGHALIAEAGGDQARADDLFQQAMTLHGEVDLPLERLQMLLEYGRFLRRSGHLQRARPLLAQAAEVSEATGADWLAGQAREELRVAGGRRRRQHADPRQLTAQEARVAALAAEGATNAEIARTLFISVSTVETHMEHIFAKLAIRSRRELRTALSDHAGATSGIVRRP